MEQVILNGMDIPAFIKLLKAAMYDEFLGSQLQSQEKSKSDLMKIDELCSEYCLNKQTVYTKVSQKKIPSIKVGKRLLFSRKKMNEWLLEHQREVVNR